MGKISTKIGVAILTLCIFLAIYLILSSYSSIYFGPIYFGPFSFKIPFISEKVTGIEKFASLEDFKIYLSKAEEISQYFGVGYYFAVGKHLDGGISMPAPIREKEMEGISEVPERVSETTVQVPGIDEPDIVKTDGKEIYFSPQRVWRILREITFKKIPPPYPYSTPKIKIIKAFPPENLALEAEIEKRGELLLIKDKKILVIFSQREILGYDVSNPQNPEKKWEIKLDDRNQIVTSRLYKGKIYLVTKSSINRVSPCPIKPLEVGGKEIEVQCGEIFHPVKPIPVDTTFFAMLLDPLSGEIKKKIAFVGSSRMRTFQNNSIVYMSKNSLYITYNYPESIIKIFSKFLQREGKDLFPHWMREKIRKLESYDISEEAKILEFQIIFKRYENSLDKDERLRIQNEFENRFSDFMKRERREIEKTGIVKINLENFKISASGEVPGFPLNQFALDEYQENLRIAVTVGERLSWWWGFGWQRESANDVYVLDKNLKIIGKIQDLGLREKIYSVRFIQDKGYLVTFRRIDPFYVLDLSNPKDPQLKGELKIPGFSSYLHPITKDKILGIGKEGWKVKISLFDVSNPKEPREVDKYILDESWSEVLKTHHAFLLDKKHQIFFLPGSKGGYIFSYKDDKLELKKALSQISAKRAIYIDDFLYIIGDEKITVLDEKTWEKIRELSLI